MIPGEIFPADGEIELNAGRRTLSITVANSGDRPIQVGSHFHFFEVNRALEFDRAAAYGKRLNISSTTAIRFEPGDETEVPLIPFGGKQTLYGFNNLVDGWTGEGVVPDSERPDKLEAIRRAAERGFKSSK